MSANSFIYTLFVLQNMAKISIVKSLRFYENQIEKMIWLKSIKIKPDEFIRNAFDKEFERQYEKRFKDKMPF